MNIKADNAFEASKQILRIIYHADTKNRNLNHHSQYGYVFVYFSIDRCKFFIERTQRKHSTEMVMRCRIIEVDKILSIVATKYTFSQIAISSILNRKLMTYQEFFALARLNFNWV